MHRYMTYSDDFYVNMNLNTEMDLPQSRETILHFFEQVQKKYPTMRNFYTRDRGEFVLEEDKDRGNYRWTSVEGRRICSGQVNPESITEAFEQHRLVLDQIPYALTVTGLDCESLNVMFGFDFTYRGNHNQLLADALGIVPAFEKLSEVAEGEIIANEPSIQFAMDADCRTQCRITFETRTSAYHVRTGEYPEEQLSVYVTVRRYGSLDPGESYVSTMDGLAKHCREIVENYMIDNILRPLQSAIAIK